MCILIYINKKQKDRKCCARETTVIFRFKESTNNHQPPTINSIINNFKTLCNFQSYSYIFAKISKQNNIIFNTDTETYN